ncbi:MAG: T9SS C-terminal target domain-containing protein [Bacteroidetes bacterium]|nr:MAG: T9SS C-terminal target domain-containing protein [Bacteroidota bacterium]
MKTKIIIPIIAFAIILTAIGYSFFSTSNKAEKFPRRHLKERGKEQADKPSEFFKYQQEIRTGDGQTKPNYPNNYKIIEYNKAYKHLQNLRLEDVPFIWTERGPANVPGRTRAIVVDPADASGKTWYAASVSGGLWRTENEGLAWSNLTPTLPNLAICAMAISPINPKTIYVGTGEGFGSIDVVQGNGIFKSIDRGLTWQQLANTANENFHFVNRLIIDPKNENIVVAATNKGIFRSEDGGNSWKQNYVGNAMQQIISQTDNFNVQYATQNGIGVVKSEDGGKTWFLQSKGITNGARFEIAISPTDPNRLFVSAEISDEASTVYVTSDGGKNWLILKEDTGINTNFMGGQGSYDNCLIVHPNDKNTVFIGGVNLWKTTLSAKVTVGTLQFSNTQEMGTQPFLDFVRATGFSIWGGRLEVSSDTTLIRSIEIRFGKGKTQKAHRFTIPAGATSGVPANRYTYKDYVNVPFEVWDTKNNQQLMVSFRDQADDGKFDLILRDDAKNILGREYVYINSIPYDPVAPNANIMVNGGHTHKSMLNFWPTLKEGTWNPDNLPESMLKINFENPVFRDTRTNNVADAYNQFGGANPTLHPDHHALTLLKNENGNFSILNGNDGGIAISKDNGNIFEHRGNSYNTTQFYSVDKKPRENVYIGGTQDNGTVRSPNGVDASASSFYARPIGGDGFAVVWNAKDPTKVLGTIYRNRVYRSTDGGINFRISTSGLRDYSSDTSVDTLGGFITRLANSRQDPDVVFMVGKSGVWKSNDFGSTWRLSAGMSRNWAYSGSLTPIRIEVSLANPNVVWAGSGMSSVANLFYSNDQGESFKAVQNYSKPIGRLSGFATHPKEPNTAYALFSVAKNPKILRTKNAGQTWEDISGFDNGETSTRGFPDVAVYSLIVFPAPDSRIWVGTEIGMFESKDDGKSWNLLQGNLPSVSIWEMKILDNQAVLATHGRGIWTADVSSITALENEKLEVAKLNIYPNPSSNGKITIDLPAENQSANVLIYDMLGQQVYQKQIQNKQQIEVGFLPAGAYIVHGNVGNKRFVGKFVKE